MDYKLLLIETFAIVVSYLVITIPLAYATNVNIIFNGNVQDTAQISSGTNVNKQINIQHDPSDRSWTRVKVLIRVNSASLAHNIERVYVYKCRALSPKDCARSTPLDFETYVDTELAWNDISARRGPAPWPEAANIMILVKLTDIDNRISWVGFWDTIERTDYNVFNIYSSELNTIDLYAESSDLIEPIKNFIENSQMIPFNWAARVVFQAAGSLYGLGASGTELDQSPPSFQVAEINTNEVTVIGNEYQFIFPNTTNGIRNPITLNLNPSFTCGNNIHEPELGENSNNCCYDAGCPSGQYCDIADVSDPASGTCRDESFSLDILPISVPTITECTNQQSIDIRARVNNPPSGLADTTTAYITIDDTLYTVSCTGEGNVYTCPITFLPAASCGTGSYSMGPNTINLTVSYNDGPNQVSRDLSRSFDDIVINYDCSCSQGLYCDIGDLVCRPDIVSLEILNVESYITNYAGGTDYISITARLNNLPTGMSISSITYELGNITYDHQSLPGMSGTITCSGDEDNVYSCSIPFSLSEYDHINQYIIRDNSLTFSITYPDGSQGNIVSKDVTAAFSDITIPSYRCGDGIINPEETWENCCVDIGCPNDNQYCDIELGCQLEDDITLSIVSLNPESFTDCDEFHTLDIRAKINNIPTNTNIVYYAYLLDNEVQSWQLSCEQPNPVTGRFECQLVIPPIEGCELPYYMLGPNQLTVTISFNDGSEQSPFFSQILKDLTASFDNINIEPIYHCGDGVCESDFGESAENCCIDCSCQEEFDLDYYCDYDPQYSPSGTCLRKSNIELIIDSVAPVSFDTCEIDNKVYIEARIKNQPSRMVPENVYGVLGGENAERIFCKEERVQEVNYTYNCTLIVPEIFGCTRGGVYEFDDNSISFFISYYDGLNRRTTQTLDARLPDITVIQGFRTIYDIMESTRNKLDAEYEGMQGIVEQAIKYTQLCIKLQIIALVANLAMILSGAIFESPFIKSIGASDRLEAAKLGAFIGGTLIASTKAICDTLTALTNVQIRMKNIKITQIQMQSCIEMYQHDIDAGRCKGREISCYNQIQGCLDGVSSIQSELGNIQNDLGNLGDEYEELNNQIIRTIREIDYIGGYATLRVKCDGVNTFCCEWSGIEREAYTEDGQRHERECNPTGLLVTISNPRNCIRPMIVMDGQFVEYTTYRRPDVSGFGWAYGTTHNFEIYCDRNNNGIPESNEKLSGSLISIPYLNDTDGDCYCRGNEIPAGVPVSQAPTVTSTTPSNGATGVQLGGMGKITNGISITFSKMMDTGVTTCSGCTITPDNNEMLMPGTWSNGMKTITFSNTMKFQPGTPYTIMVMGLKNMAKDKTMQMHTFSFTTAGEEGEPEGTVVTQTTCTSGGQTYNCMININCEATGGTPVPQLCGDFEYGNYYIQSDDIWYEYDQQVEGSTPGDDIQCCVTGGEEPQNQPPTANAGPDQIIDCCTPATLDGSASSDPEDCPDGDSDGSCLSYMWMWRSGFQDYSDSNVGSLSPMTAQKPTFTPAMDTDGTVTYTLTVTDNNGVSHQDDVTITINDVM